MMKILFGDIKERVRLLPLTYTRPVAKIRCGILTLEEKWSLHFEGEFGYATTSYLQKAFPLDGTNEYLLINSCLLPTPELVEAIKLLSAGETLFAQETWIAARLDTEGIDDYRKTGIPKGRKVTSDILISTIERPWHIFQQNGAQIRLDFEHLTKNRDSANPHETTTLIGRDIFIEEGAEVVNCSLNALNGPIYIGKNAKVEDGVHIKGPFALCEGSVANMGAKLRPDTTVGPYCKVGGEISNSVFQGYSNKGHDGFLGNAVIGEWCNLGADTNSSNLKNDYGPVSIWDYETEKPIDTGSQFCGLIMGDHSKCGINTMFNTGTVVGVFANIFGAGFPQKFIPSFSWGGADGFDEYRMDKALQVAERVMSRRKKVLSETDIEILNTVFNQTKKFRTV